MKRLRAVSASVRHRSGSRLRPKRKQNSSCSAAECDSLFTPLAGLVPLRLRLCVSFSFFPFWRPRIPRTLVLWLRVEIRLEPHPALAHRVDVLCLMIHLPLTSLPMPVPYNTVPPYYSYSALPYDCPWSVVTRDSALGPAPTASPVGHAAYDPHPNPDADPFAKAAGESGEVVAFWRRWFHICFWGIDTSATPRRGQGWRAGTGARARRTRVRGRVPTTEEREVGEGRKDEREAEAEDSGVYLYLDAGPDREQLPTPPPSPSLSRPSSFVPARCSTPPPPSPPSSCVAPPTAYSPPLELGPTTSNLTRAPTAQTYPLPPTPSPLRVAQARGAHGPTARARLSPLR
ncbi:hypothetical protein B0H13DRAFT_2330293 [Mycena leptocephala]|nr:hypothetical protein B0H13DRAFT_2330293 [Mycena leptocephala]